MKPQLKGREKSIKIRKYGSLDQKYKYSTFDFDPHKAIESSFDACTNEASTRRSRKIDRNSRKKNVLPKNKNKYILMNLTHSMQLKLLPIHVRMKPQLEGPEKSTEISQRQKKNLLLNLIRSRQLKVLLIYVRMKPQLEGREKSIGIFHRHKKNLFLNLIRSQQLKVLLIHV